MSIRQDTLRDRWLAANNYAASTQATYSHTLRSFERRFPVHAERVTEAMLVDFITTDANGQPTRRAPNTLDRQRNALRSFWRWCYRNGYVRADITARLDDVSLGKGEARPGRWLSPDEALRLLEAAQDGTEQGERNHALIAVALLTGLRRAELAGLRWRDVDLAQRRLSVRGKGRKYATVGLPDEAATAVSRWRETAIGAQGHNPRADDPVFATGRLVGGINDSERFYFWDWHAPLRVWSIRRIVARAAIGAGLGVVGTHDLRRSFAGFLDEKGEPLQNIQAALRHSSPATTSRCYLDRSPRRAIAAVTDLSLRSSGGAESLRSSGEAKPRSLSNPAERESAPAPPERPGAEQQESARAKPGEPNKER